MLGRWIALFPPGSDQNVSVILLILRYLFKKLIPGQGVENFHFSLFICILKLLESDSFSLCLHNKVDEMLSIVFTILARGKLNDMTTILEQISNVSTLWSTEKNFIDSLMKHHHSSSVLGFAVQTGLVDAVLRNFVELIDHSQEIPAHLFIAQTSLWLSLLYPFSHHNWIKHLLSEECINPDFQKNVVEATDIPVVYVEGSNKLLRQLQSNEISIEDWCLVRSKSGDSIRGSSFSLEKYDRYLVWVAKYSLQLLFNPTLESFYHTLIKNYQITLFQSINGNSGFTELLSIGINVLKMNECPLRETFLLATLHACQLANTCAKKDSLISVLEVLDISTSILLQQQDSSPNLFFKVVQSCLVLLKCPFPDIVANQNLSSLLTRLCEIFSVILQSNGNQEFSKIVMSGMVCMLGQVLNNPNVILASACMKQITHTTLSLLLKLTESSDSYSSDLYSPFLLCLYELHFNVDSLSDLEHVLENDATCFPRPLSEGNLLKMCVTDSISPLNQVILDLLQYLSFSSYHRTTLTKWLLKITEPDDIGEEGYQEHDPSTCSILHLMDLGCDSHLQHYSSTSLIPLESHLHEITRAMMWDINWCITQGYQMSCKMDISPWVSENVDISTGFDDSIEAEIDLRRQVIDPNSFSQSLVPNVSVITSEPAQSLEDLLRIPQDHSFSPSKVQTEVRNIDQLNLLPGTIFTSHDEMFTKYIFYYFLNGSIPLSSEDVSRYLSIYYHYLKEANISECSQSFNIFLAVLSIVSYLSHQLYPSTRVHEIVHFLNSSRDEGLVLAQLRLYQEGKFHEDCQRRGIIYRSFLRNMKANWFYGWLPFHEILRLTDWLVNTPATSSSHELTLLMASLVIHGIEVSTCPSTSTDVLKSLLSVHAAPRGTFQRIQPMYQILKVSSCGNAERV